MASGTTVPPIDDVKDVKSQTLPSRETAVTEIVATAAAAGVPLLLLKNADRGCWLCAAFQLPGNAAAVRCAQSEFILQKNAKLDDEKHWCVVACGHNQYDIPNSLRKVWQWLGGQPTAEALV
jgi:hypothetical protein